MTAVTRFTGRKLETWISSFSPRGRQPLAERRDLAPAIHRAVEEVGNHADVAA